MDPDTLATSGAFGTALMLASTPIDALAPRAAPPNPAAVLASLMDFPGSVALAELLDEPAASGPSAPDAALRADRLWREVRARLDSLENQALKPLLGRRAPETPPPDELLRVLCTNKVQVERTDERVRRVSEVLSAPFGSAFGTSLRQAQAHVATLRWELTHEIRALGPRANRIERIDAAITRSMQAKVGLLLDRMEHSAAITFEKACAHAIAALPDDFTEDDLAPWCAPGGWLDRYRERCVRMTRALYGHLRRSLEGLLRAASHAERS